MGPVLNTFIDKEEAMGVGTEGTHGRQRVLLRIGRWVRRLRRGDGGDVVSLEIRSTRGCMRIEWKGNRLCSLLPIRRL